MISFFYGIIFLVIYMAVEVVIRSKGLFKKKLDFKSIIESDMRYGIMDEAYRLEEGKVGENTVIFPAGNVCRGYELSLKKGEINLRMPLPTSKDDITFFYDFIKRLCGKMNTKIFLRDDEVVKLTDTYKCIQLDIEASEGALKRIKEDITNKKYENMYIFGAVNPIAIGKREIDIIEGDIEKFGNLLNDLQKMDVYYAKASVYQRKDETYFGVYVLTDGVTSVLPYQAKLLTNDNGIKINDWNIGFVIDGKLEGFISYENFLKNIVEDKEYDTEHFVITMNTENMKKLLSKYKVDL